MRGDLVIATLQFLTFKDEYQDAFIELNKQD